MRNPCYFRSKSFNMVFFFLKHTFRNKERKINIRVTRFFKLAVKLRLNIFPNSKPIRLNDHCSTHWSIIYEFSLLDNIGIPLSKVILHRGNFFNKLFVRSEEHTSELQ